jgi:hypothetical protein
VTRADKEALVNFLEGEIINDIELFICEHYEDDDEQQEDGNKVSEANSDRPEAANAPIVSITSEEA